MKIVAYCAKRYEAVTRRVISGEVSEYDFYTSPPLTDETFEKNRFVLSGYDLVIFNLHGWPRSSVWTGNNDILALKASTLREHINLYGAGVFAINCFLGDPDSPMREALFDAGASFVVGGDGVNFGGISKPAGADVLLKYFLRQLLRGTEPEKALSKAKRSMKIFGPKWSISQVMAIVDANGFQLWRRQHA